LTLNEEIPENVCCICGHPLNSHIDEGEGWRCHSLDASFYQCECWLRKHEFASTIDYYDLKKRRDSNTELSDLLNALKEES